MVMACSWFSALYWPFVRGIHRSPVNSPHKGQWRRVWCFLWAAPWINAWVNNREAGDLRRYSAHYHVIVMIWWTLGLHCHITWTYRKRVFCIKPSIHTVTLLNLEAPATNTHQPTYVILMVAVVLASNRHQTTINDHTDSAVSLAWHINQACVTQRMSRVTVITHTVTFHTSGWFFHWWVRLFSRR